MKKSHGSGRKAHSRNSTAGESRVALHHVWLEPSPWPDALNDCSTLP